MKSHESRRIKTRAGVNGTKVQQHEAARSKANAKQVVFINALQKYTNYKCLVENQLASYLVAHYALLSPNNSWPNHLIVLSRLQFSSQIFSRHELVIMASLSGICTGCDHSGRSDAQVSRPIPWKRKKRQSTTMRPLLSRYRSEGREQSTLTTATWLEWPSCQFIHSICLWIARTVGIGFCLLFPILKN